MSNKITSSLLLLMGLVISPVMHAEEKQELSSEKDLALKAMNNMSSYLRELDQFSIRANIYIDEVLENGQKIQQTKRLDISANPPTKLKISESDMGGNRELYYNGNEFTVYTENLGFYASFNAPKTIAGVIAKASDDYDIEIPLSDLFMWGTDNDSSTEVDEAILVGVDSVDGVSCNSFAFRQKEVDWQICIQRGTSPLPLKLVITSKLEETQPKYVAVLKWDTAPHLSETIFSFAPRLGDQEIQFSPSQTNK